MWAKGSVGDVRHLRRLVVSNLRKTYALVSREESQGRQQLQQHPLQVHQLRQRGLQAIDAFRLLESEVHQRALQRLREDRHLYDVEMTAEVSGDGQSNV